MATEQVTLSNNELKFAGILEDKDRKKISEALASTGPHKVEWTGFNDRGNPVKVEFSFDGKPQSPLKLIFGIGEDLSEHDNVNVNPYNKGQFGLGPDDIADFFVIAHNALVDGVNSKNAARVFTYELSRIGNDIDTQSDLARALINTKYLP